MNDEQHPILEIIAPSVEEAIEKGLAELNLPEDAVEVEILDRGNRGLFGLGSRQARIRLVVKGQASAGPVERKLIATPAKDEEDLEAGLEEELEEEGEAEAAADLDDTPLEVARATVEELLSRMNIGADVTAHYQSGEQEGSRPVIWVDINGKDLSILIGKRTQTLQALQYISALIVSKELGRSVALIIDVEGYRTRRQAQLRRLAQSMAEQVVKTGRRQTLEPMPASERRIIHIELRSHPGVTTESAGEEPNRKVTIIPKKPA
jgi:spoIIIJ-associated protein